MLRNCKSYASSPIGKRSEISAQYTDKIDKDVTFPADLLLFRDDHGLERYEQCTVSVALVSPVLRQVLQVILTYPQGHGGTSDLEQVV